MGPREVVRYVLIIAASGDAEQIAKTRLSLRRLDRVLEAAQKDLDIERSEKQREKERDNLMSGRISVQEYLKVD